MSTPRITVIIPCFNDGRYIDEAVESVLAQSCQDFEIIIVDDGSTDAFTTTLLSDYRKPKTRVIATPNQGRAEARNTGIREARGEYIFPLDADDRIADTYLEKALAVLVKRPDIAMVYCLADYFGDRQGRWELPAYRFPEILVRNCIFNSALYRKSDWDAAGGYNPNMKYGKEDRDFWLSLIERGKTPYRIDEVLFHYRIVGTTTDHGMSDYRRLHSHLMLFRNHKALYLRNLVPAGLGLARATLKHELDRLFGRKR